MKPHIEMPQCQCCNKNVSVGFASVPGMPVSIAWCQECVDAGVTPYGILVFNVGMAGKIQSRDDIVATFEDWYVDEIDRTLSYFDVSFEQFVSDINDRFGFDDDSHAQASL